MKEMIVNLFKDFSVFGLLGLLFALAGYFLGNLNGYKKAADKTEEALRNALPPELFKPVAKIIDGFATRLGETLETDFDKQKDTEVETGKKQ